MINATLSGSAHGGRRVAELGGGGWLPVLFFSRPLSLLYLKWFHSPALHFCYCFLSISILVWFVHSPSIFYYNVSCALKFCSHCSYTSCGLLIILLDFLLHSLSPLHLLSLFIYISLLSHLDLPLLLLKLLICLLFHSIFTFLYFTYALDPPLSSCQAEIEVWRCRFSLSLHHHLAQFQCF